MLFTADRVCTGAEVLSPGFVEVTDGLITGVGAGAPDRPADSPLGAVTVVPGFVDMHTHGGGSGAFPEASEAGSRAAVDLHRRHGTTTLIASLVSAHPAELLRQASVLGEQVQDGLIAGIHLEGPWLSSLRCGAHEPSALRAPDLDEIDRVFAAAKGGVRMVTIAPELDGALPAIRRMVELGAVAAVGHTDASYAGAKAAVEAGATAATHLFNAMRPIHHREPGPVLALLEDPRVMIELIVDGVHLHPALYRSVTREAGPDRVALITDAMAAAGMADGSYTLGALTVDVTNGVAHIAGTDTIAGSTATMDRVFRNAVLASDLPREQALAVAVRQTSLNPARAIGLPGAGLVVGTPADLVVLSDDLVVQRVLHQGTWATGV
ncbi:MAG: N-acetylglucosamine-6-phosphate deacetylase [Micropruina sp.]|nr:N-acetylglucosamine-6-phosphate deacetylase [Micropruina sp.]